MLRYTSQAEQDLTEIDRYTVDAWGIEQAIRYLGDLEACFERLAKAPALGRACDDIASGLRRFEHRSHVVFYRKEKNGIVVIRVLHHRRLPGQHIVDEDKL